MANKLTYNTKVENGGTTADGRFSALEANDLKNKFNANADLIDANATAITGRQTAIKQQMEQFSDAELTGAVNDGYITKSFTLTGDPLANFIIEIMNQNGYVKSVMSNGKTYLVTYPANTTQLLLRYVVANSSTAVTLVAIALSGNSSINEGTSASYVVTGTYSDGSTANLTTSSTLSTTEGSINSAGLLSVASNLTIGDGRTLTVSATLNAFTAGKTVNVIDTSSLVVPNAPTAGMVDDTANTFNWTNTNGYTALSAYEFTVDGGSTYAAVTVKPLVIGDVAKAVGQVGVRVKAVANVNTVSNTLFNSVAFTVAGLLTPSAPTASIVDDTANTFNWTNNPNYTTNSLYEYTLDGGITYTTVTSKPLVVGNISKAIGQVGVRVKSGSGNNSSATLFNTVAFTALSGTDTVVFRDTFPVTTSGVKLNSLNWLCYKNQADEIAGLVTVQLQNGVSESIVPINAGYSTETSGGYPELGISNQQALFCTSKYPISQAASIRQINFWIATWQDNLKFSPAIKVGSQWYVNNIFKNVAVVSNGNNHSVFEKFQWIIDYYAVATWTPLEVVLFSPGGPSQLMALGTPLTGALPSGSITAFGLYSYNLAGVDQSSPIKLDNYEIIANV